MNDPDQRLQKLQKKVQKLTEEKNNRLEIFEAIHEGIIVFQPNLSIRHINSHAQSLLMITQAYHPEDPIRLYKNRKASIRFKLHHWLECIMTDKITEPREVDIWFNHPKTLKSIPLMLSAKCLCNAKGEVKQLLLLIYDRSLQSQVAEQKRLMQAAFNNFNAQFITNDKGYLIEANGAFKEMSGLTHEQSKKINLLEWLENHVSGHQDSQQILSTLHKELKWYGEVEISNPSQESLHAAMSISMLLDKDQNLEHFVVVIQNINEIKEAHEQIEHMAFYDGLTGLANRKLAIEHINSHMRFHERHKTFSAILNINLDRFKSINDAFGRITGDRFIKRISLALKSVLRGQDLLARLGGDEFVIVTQDQAKSEAVALQNATRLAHKVLDTLNHHFQVDSLTLHGAARIGLIVYPNDKTESAESLLVKSDLAVTRAKEVRRKYKVYIFEHALAEEVKQKRQLEDDLREAHNRGEIILNFQAQIDQQQKLYGAEVLVRWKHPQHGLIPPNRFIPLAEESRQIVALGNWIMLHAFKQAKQWCKQKPNLNISVNISPIQFHEADFINHVISSMMQARVNPGNITLELTENVFISDTESALYKISELNELGFKVAIDDFGTGYSSLSYFQKLPIHELKIDKSFVDKVPNSNEDIAIIESIIHLAKSKNLHLVAEGVETEEQVKFLQEKQKSMILQGYFYSRPCSSANFAEQFL